MKYGLARVSTKGQALDGNSIEGQIAALKATGAEEVVEEHCSGAKEDRPVLNS